MRTPYRMARLPHAPSDRPSLPYSFPLLVFLFAPQMRSRHIVKSRYNPLVLKLKERERRQVAARAQTGNVDCKARA